MADALPNDVKGVVAILSGPDGRTVATAADFLADMAGGCTLRETQESRVRRELARVVIDQACAPYIAAAINGYDCWKIMNSMISQQGYVLTVVPVGHDEEA
jgi:hypothetical protein